MLGRHKQTGKPPEHLPNLWRLTRKEVDLKAFVRLCMEGKMAVLQTEGVVLQTIPFKEYDRIVKLFTPHGLLKLFVKGKKRNTLQYGALTSPLCVGEYAYSQGNSDLYRFHEGALLKPNLRIRERLEALETAGKLIHAVFYSQWPSRAAPPLYLLFCHLLEKMPNVEYPERLIPLFLLKILKYEGVLQLTSLCSNCGTFADYRFGGACYCQKHAPNHAFAFTRKEEELLQQMVYCRSLKKILVLSTTKNFIEKIEILFKYAFC